ncbi:MAG TPA: hypothetical protein VF575_03005 [Candidatus Saccharimonadales bacterium]|jgi:hypothetical protein
MGRIVFTDYFKSKQRAAAVVRTVVRRAQYSAMSGILLFSAIFSFMPATASAYGALTNRSILMSSTASAATNVAYSVSFTTVTDNQNIGSVVVEFCSNSPIIGDSCSIASGFDTNYASLSLNNVTGNITGLSINTAQGTSTSNRVVLTRTPGAVANGPVSFTLGNGTTNGLTNPANDNTTFYARILTFSSTTGSGSETLDSLDAGGIALSTANQLNVTAKVQETLTFCVYTGADCAAGGTGIALGDTNGVLLNTSTTYTGNAYYDVASNSFGGVSVKIKGDTLKSGSFSISPHGNACTQDSTVGSEEQFGLRISALGTDQLATAPFDCATGFHGFDPTFTNTLYGQEIGKTSGPNDVSGSTIEFAAKSAGTTEAGVYTTTLTLIATATY